MKKSRKIVLLVIIIISFSLSFNNINYYASQNEQRECEDLPKINHQPCKDTLIVGTVSGPLDLEPLNAQESYSWDVIRQAVEGLFMINYTDPDLGRIPMLALDEGTWSDSTTWTVDLRQGVLFHDGTPFNATAVEWNWERLTYFLNYTGTLPGSESESETKSFYCLSDGITPIVNSTTVESTYQITFHLNAPFSPFLNLLTHNPSYILSPTSTPQYQHINTTTGDIVGTGPFVYDEYVSDVEVQFHRWNQYWRTPAQIQNLTFSVIQDESERNNAMLAGDIDVLLGETESLLPTFRANPNITVHDTGAGFNYDYLGMNNEQINVTWRKAISYALDYDYIIDELMQGQAVRAYSPLSPSWNVLVGWNQSTELDTPVFNTTHARKILVDAGISSLPIGDGTENITLDNLWKAQTYATFNYSYNTDNQFRVDMYPVLRDNLDVIGIVVTDGPLDWETYIYRAYGYAEPGGFDKLQLYWVGWGPDYIEPWIFLDPLFNNASGHNSAQVNDPVIQTLLMNVWGEMNNTLITEIYKQILGDLTGRLYPHVFGFHKKVYDVYAKRLHGYANNTLNALYVYPCYWELGNYAIEISQPSDFSYIRGTTGNNITWTVTAENISSALYSIYKDSILNKSGSWTPGNNISINVDGLTVGTHECSIELHYDGLTWEDIVIINVFNVSLEISKPPDFSYIRGTTGNNITWTVTSENVSSALYYIYKDSILNKSDTWTPGNDIVINIDDLSVGTHEFSIEIHYDDLIWEDIVIIEVLVPIPPPPLIAIVLIIVSGTLIGIGVSLTFIIRKKRLWSKNN